MPDNTLQFETRVDLSGLNAGFDEAQSKVDSFSGSVSDAMKKAQTAAQNLTDAQKAFGKAAADGSQQAAAVIKQYESELNSANDAIKSVTSSVAEQTRVTGQLSIEQRRQYEEYIAQVKAEEAATSAASAHQLSALQATSAITRELSSGSSIRAVENFISKTLGLGPAMQAVFPVVGAIAFGEVIFDVGKKFYDAFDLGGERARKAANDIAEAENEALRMQADLDVRLQKLIAQKEHLEGRAATNGLALELAEATKNALDLDKALESVNKEREKALGSMGASLPQRILGTAGNKDETVMLQEHTRHMNEATTAQAQLNEQSSYGAVLQEKLSELQFKKASAEQLAISAASNGASVNIENYDKEIASVQQLIKWKEEDQKLIQTTQKVDTEQTDVNTLRGNKTPKGPQINRIQLMIEELNQATQINNAFHERIQAMWEQDNRAEMEAYRKGEQADNERTELFKKNQKEMAIAAGEAADATHNTNLGTIEQAQTRSTNANALSLVQDPVGQLQALRNFHQQADAENERYYAEEIKIASGDNELEKVKQLENKMMEVRRAANLRQLNDAKAIALQEAQAQQQALQKIETDIATTFAKSLTTQESWAQASIKLYQQVADQFITNLVKMGEQELVALALHKSVASQKILADAKSAAGNAYDWASAWGGPIAGAISAAAAFAGVMAFDSFEQGGIVNGSHGMPVPIMAHAGERVLTAGQTQKFESMVNHGSSSSSSVNLHYNPQVNAYDSSGMRSMLRAHMSDVHDMVNQGIRSGAIRARG